MAKLGMTKRQTDCLNFIKKYIGENGIPPSNEEIIEGLGLTAKSGAVRLLLALEDRGHIIREKFKARSIALVPDPDQELEQLREIRAAAFSFINAQKNWREQIAIHGEIAMRGEQNSNHADRVKAAFNELDVLVSPMVSP